MATAAQVLAQLADRLFADRLLIRRYSRLFSPFIFEKIPVIALIFSIITNR